MRPTVAAIVPVLNEASGAADFLAALVRRPGIDEVIVVDGGSADGTVETAARVLAATAGPHAQLLATPRDRARQMNAGAAAATADVLFFVHADSCLPPEATEHIAAALADGHVWGRFDVRVSGRSFAFRVIERAMNLRSAWSGIATGDQAIFVRRDVFRLLGGFAAIPIMEDIELCSRLKWIGPPARIRAPVVTSARRWEHGGIVRTLLRMWLLRALFAVGVPAVRLARWYR